MPKLMLMGILSSSKNDLKQKVLNYDFSEARLKKQQSRWTLAFILSILLLVTGGILLMWLLIK